MLVAGGMTADLFAMLYWSQPSVGISASPIILAQLVQ